VKIQIFGDLQEPSTAQIDRTVRDAMAGREDIRYEFRYFPADQSCNPHVQRSPYPLGCKAARIAEAAGQLGGPDVYWRMHDWLMSNQQQFTDANLRAFAPTIGLSPDVLLATTESTQVSEAIAGDVSIGQRLHITSIPRVSVNGKLVARWNLTGEFIMARVIEEAAMGR
jgi:protein-disulfide isomerase